MSQQEPTREEKLAHLERVLASRSFHSSGNLKAFLEFAGRKAVEHQDESIKEYTIAHDVFGRDSTYDPKVDSLVRVQASRLRRKLEEYYRHEGRGDIVRIDLPKGHYKVTFSMRNGGTQAGRRPDAGYRLAAALMAVSCVVMGALAWRMHTENVRLQQEAEDGLALRQAVAPVWEAFLQSPEPLLVTYSNTVFEGLPDKGMRLFRDLDASSLSFGMPALAGNDGSVPITDHYTGVGEVAAVYHLGALLWGMDRQFDLKRSLLLTWDDLKRRDVIVLGSPAENFLLRELPQRQDFVFRSVPVKGEDRFAIVNLQPAPGEEKYYLAHMEGPSFAELRADYALISKFTGLSEGRSLLILAGTKTAGTHAAAEYMSKPSSLQELMHKLNIAPAGAAPRLPQSYQVLLKVEVKGGVPVQTSYLTHHVLD